MSEFRVTYGLQVGENSNLETDSGQIHIYFMWFVFSHRMYSYRNEILASFFENRRFGRIKVSQ